MGRCIDSVAGTVLLVNDAHRARRARNQMEALTVTLPRNVGTIDRIARLVLGISLVAIFVAGVVAAPWGWIALALGVIMLGTAAVGYCPIYSLVGLSSCPLRK